ncbi:MAG: ABC transporter ATP-binding protein, partial [Alphaproteobacteria bacterium]
MSANETEERVAAPGSVPCPEPSKFSDDTDGKPVIRARALSKRYGDFVALHPSSFEIPLGRIYGVIGPNGAGKTTLLDSMLGLISYEGELDVLGREPLRERAQLMEDACFIADVATLPRWMRVVDLLDYVEGVHPRFDRSRALDFLARTNIPLGKRVRALSKGMITQLHLAIVMAIDARLLVLDEPTLGLDILFRKNFYTALLEEYFDESRTILVATHQVEEVEHILTDVLFIKQG